MIVWLSTIILGLALFFGQGYRVMESGKVKVRGIERAKKHVMVGASSTNKHLYPKRLFCCSIEVHLEHFDNKNLREEW